MNGGIYIITNKVDSKIYLGSTNNLKKRKTDHFTYLKHNKHKNIHLQRAYNQYGKDNFVFSILEEINDLELLRQEEQNWLNILGRGEIYNMQKNVRGYNIDSLPMGVKHSKHRKISVFDLNMNFIEEVEGMRETNRKYKVSDISSCCTGKCNSLKGFIFRYSDKLEVPFIGQGHMIKSDFIYCYDFEGNFIESFNSYTEATKKTKLSKTTIVGDLKNQKHKIKFRKIKYIFSLLKPEEYVCFKEV